MKLFVFASANVTNIWAGVGAGMWAVSHVDAANTKARATRAANVRIGSVGIIYCSKPDIRALTTPFIFLSQPDVDEQEDGVWPQSWRMPFSIHPLGTPRRFWSAREAIAELPFNAGTGNTNIASVLRPLGTAVFSPLDIGEDDWAMLLTKLADRLAI